MSGATARTSSYQAGASWLETRRRALYTGVPQGLDVEIVADAARLTHQAKEATVSAVFVARDGNRLAAFAEALAFFRPDVASITFPAWDCLPYDRVSPAPDISAERLSTLARLRRGSVKRSRVLLTTVAAVLQRTVPRSFIDQHTMSLRPGRVVDLTALLAWCERNGFERTSTVREPGDVAVRGGIVDLYPAGRANPVRLDFFGDTLETVRSFDAETQRSLAQEKRLDLVPMSEVSLDEEAIRRFRQGYLALFGGATGSYQVYESVSAGKRMQGMEHWLPLFHETTETVFAHIGDAPVFFDHLSDDARQERLKLAEDYHAARERHLEEKDGSGYKPIPVEQLYLADEAWEDALSDRRVADITPFELESSVVEVIPIGARMGRNFAAERADAERNVFDALASHIGDLHAAGKRVLVTAFTEGGRDRMADMLGDHGVTPIRSIARFADLGDRKTVLVAQLGLEAGFETSDLAVIGEQDILGDRYIRRNRKSRKGADFLSEVASLSTGDLVVHVDHGIGRFVGLRTIEAAGAPHDCLEVHYAGGDKLFLPVENIELLSRYGSDAATAQLDRLGGGAWQARKARLKQRIRDMADKLIKTAAKRSMRSAPKLLPDSGLFDEFSARFPYEETDDQATAITATLEDLSAGQPMERLICGDVGFGKTEIALRAAFVAAAAGKQVAVVVPTTLLARQHYRTFMDRFHDFPLRLAQASRMVGQKALSEVKTALADSSIDIVIGTHALLGKAIKFKDLGLLIVDEEQHFGVAHKERLKELAADIHVLTLSATPIPRTLQLAMSGIRDLSIIATPPVDRLSVRTYITPFDPVILREAILREHYRSGQTFFVCPRIADIEECHAFLQDTVPEVRTAVAHGQMSPSALEDVMTAFYDGRYDVLLSTAIVESGLDVPTANTLIVHRSDMFGLAQLHQLRGRVGRSKIRAYAYFTTPEAKPLTPAAEKRLRVLQSLDSLGAGFMLASHDLDIRGAGNLLGDEQSGHIKEVGFELYQSMLEEAVAALRDGDDEVEDGQWSPQIALGAPVMIPDHYVEDLDVRMTLYRRLGQITGEEEIDEFARELADRFGAPPREIGDLLDTVKIKLLCRRAGVDRVEAGPKGLLIGLRNDRFANPAGLVGYVSDQAGRAKVRPDNRIFLSRSWADAGDRMSGTRRILGELAELAEAA
ncbi:MAG: transcription-repair coupling factor [Pseudomonadota bacterium]